MMDKGTLVLFGAKGNLARVKLIPGLFHLDLCDKLPPDMKILSVGRQEVDAEAWLDEIQDMLEKKFKGKYSKTVFDRFIKRNLYHCNSPDDPAAFKKFAARLSNENEFTKNIAFFLSVRPSDFALIVDQLAEHELLNESKGGYRRVLIEKPFGTDLKTAIELQSSIEKHLKESQIYRIDHYLGKSALQNILITRFANSIFEPIWNSHNIDHIQITNHEQLGVGERTTFYDATGALRDMVQSHLLQMLALITMEKPKSFNPDDIREEKIKVLESIKKIPLNNMDGHVFRAQYKRGEINGERVPGYLEELEKDGLGNSSFTETYAAIKLFIDNERWKDVPIYLRTAKRLHEAGTYISIKFKNKNTLLENANANWLVISIQPIESTHFEIQTKIPGLNDFDFRTVNLECLNRIEGDESIDAYETLMLDLMNGNQSRFLHINEVKAQWKLIDQIIDYWSEKKSPMVQYTAGSSDPTESKRIFERDDQFWRKSIHE